MPHPIQIFSQSDCLIQIVDTNSLTEWQTMQIKISWLLKKPTDLDLHCLQRQGISVLSRTRVKQELSQILILTKCQALYSWKNKKKVYNVRMLFSAVVTGASRVKSRFLKCCLTSYTHCLISYTHCLISYTHCLTSYTHCLISYTHCLIGYTHCLTSYTHCLIGYTHCLISECDWLHSLFDWLHSLFD